MASKKTEIGIDRREANGIELMIHSCLRKRLNEMPEEDCRFMNEMAVLMRLCFKLYRNSPR
ncbi:hypothetical protein J4447_01525 [Candidatus Pacearchaeota archaeon]|nr:hypothetical protein [Candidatus Pacearchaeota archaeon]